MMDKDREGRPPFVLIQDNVTIVKTVVLQDQLTTVKQLWIETGISV